MTQAITLKLFQSDEISWVTIAISKLYSIFTSAKQDIVFLLRQHQCVIFKGIVLLPS